MEHYICLHSQHLACRDWDTIPSPRTAQDTQWFQSQTELRAKTIFQKTKDCEFGSVVKRVQSMHRTWLDPQNCEKTLLVAFAPSDMTFCPVFWGILPRAISLIGRSILVTRAALFTSQQMVTLTMRNGKFFSLRLKSNFYENSEKCDLLSWGGLAHCLHSKRWHFIWSNQDSETFVPHPRRGWDRR